MATIGMNSRIIVTIIAAAIGIPVLAWAGILMMNTREIIFLGFMGAAKRIMAVLHNLLFYFSWNLRVYDCQANRKIHQNQPYFCPVEKRVMR